MLSSAVQKNVDETELRRSFLSFYFVTRLCTGLSSNTIALGVLGMFFLLLLLVGRVLSRVTPMLFRRLYWGFWVQYRLYMLPLSMMATALHLLISNLSFIGNFDHEPHA